MKNVTIVKFL